MGICTLPPSSRDIPRTFQIHIKRRKRAGRNPSWIHERFEFLLSHLSFEDVTVRWFGLGSETGQTQACHCERRLQPPMIRPANSIISLSLTANALEGRPVSNTASKVLLLNRDA